MKIVHHITLLLLLLCLAGCDGFVEVEVPNSQLTGKVVFENTDTANAALIALYAKLRDNGLLAGNANGSAALLGMYADELLYYGNNENILSVANSNLLALSPIALQKWSESYHQIYGANAIIEGCSNATALPREAADRFTGEALFIRALVYSYLVNLYGDLPYATTTNYMTNRALPRLPVAEVYQGCIGDLEQAIGLLPEQYVAAERVRPNRAAAQALLARLYLYNGQWAEAANTASAVLNQSEWSLEPDLTKVFLRQSTETIWQFSPQSAAFNALEGATFIFQTGPPTFVSLRPELYEAFAEGDLRKANWIGVKTNGTATWYHPYKYRINTNTGTSSEYSVVLRLAELCLVRAEARARQGELVAAKGDLDTIRSRAGLPPTTAVTRQQIIDAILEERRRELFTEFGHRFFDLKRTGRLDTAMPAFKPAWETTAQRWPIPEAEILANTNLTQNDGY